PHRRARRAVVRLRAGEPADGGTASAGSRSGHHAAGGGADREQDAGRGGWAHRSRRDRGRQARRSDPGARRRPRAGGADGLARGAPGGVSPTPAPTALPIGPGRLIVVVGPSGAGKDTLIGLARAELAPDSRVIFPKRVITRPSSSAEDNDAVASASFDATA